jgi:branched-chain amino acid transport system ATP-binding protein
MTVLLEIGHLAVRYGQIAALRDVSLEVRKGEAVALVGANGAGKTTLLKSIIGLVGTAGGTIALNGTSLARQAPHKRARLGLGYCPEGRRVFPGLTVRENLEVASPRRGAAVAARRDEVFALFPNLAERRDVPGWQLSGGQQQMLAIGRALMTEPQLLLLDEPSLGLSPLLVGQVLDRVRDIVASGASVLLAEQNMAKALAVADRAYVLQLGIVALSGPAAEIAASAQVKKAFLGG